MSRLYGHGSFHPFSGEDLNDCLIQKEQALKDRIQQENDDYILSVGEDSFIQYLIEQGRVDPLFIAFDNITVDTESRMIPAERFPSNFNVYPGKSYSKTVLIYRIPFIGDRALLNLCPSSRILSGTPEIFIQQQEGGESYLCFENVSFDDDAHDQQLPSDSD